MGKQFHGAYESKQDALHAINELREQGTGSSAISLVVDNGRSLRSGFTTTSQNEGFLEGIMESLSGIDYDNDPIKQLQALGFDQQEYKKYESYLKEGKSLVFVDNE